MRWKPPGRTCSRNRRTNSSASSVMVPIAATDEKRPRASGDGNSKRGTHDDWQPGPVCIRVPVMRAQRLAPSRGRFARRWRSRLRRLQGPVRARMGWRRAAAFQQGAAIPGWGGYLLVSRPSRGGDACSFGFRFLEFRQYLLRHRLRPVRLRAAVSALRLLRLSGFEHSRRQNRCNHLSAAQFRYRSDFGTAA